MSLMEQFANPETIHSLSFGEKMLGSTITMVMGMGITFLILILIWIFIAIMGKCLGTGEKKKAAPAPAAAVPAAEPAPVAETSDDALVAVIAAAVAAYQGANANNLVVKSITRVSGENTPWGASALEDRLETRKW